ncbi:type VI secretion system TssO [Aquimarina sp. MMG016]|uniref:type VI secretion system TssO n=1 Tax=Aquimarina sp. MMG016 TaxID=2822690 RepID=UPI001B39CE67|nr:type VI secretion system TssO [Aquimarina sp. MMG016]MBQ4821288.1 type VI secretion system transmembrane protein TssO [Aquimarina sp. MMG016]
MKPKNSKERRNSILKFSLLFLFTTALIVTAFYFDFDRVPFKENAVWRERSALIEKEMEYQKKFSKGMKEVRSLIDSLDVPGQNLQYLNQVISSKIVDLQKTIPKEDSTYRYDMYTNIIDSYVNIHDLKTKLREFDDVDERIEEYKEELEKTRKELNEANRYLDAVRR